MREIAGSLIDGAVRLSAAPERVDVVDPTTEAVLGQVPRGAAADASAAITAAAAAFESWRSTPVTERASLLRAWHGRLVARADELAELVHAELGAPVALARRVHLGLPLGTLADVADTLETYDLEEQVGPSLVVQQPAGVAAAISPWNYPLHQAMAKVAPALAAGCTVVLKPSELAPFAVHEAMLEAMAAGLPAGVLNVVHGTGADVGSPLASDPRLDLVSFTGSVEAGRDVAGRAGAAGTRVLLELGGKSANIVLPDVSDELFARAVRTGVARCLLNAGQTCNAWSRLLVPRARYDEALALAATEAATYVPGERLGPMVSAAHRERVLGFITRAVAAGARIATGGIEPPAGLDRGFWVRPTVLAEVPRDAEIAREEVFGPVLVVLPYDGEEDAFALAEDTAYGLAAGVWADDLDQALAFARRLRVGQVDVNGARFNPVAPFGGFKASGFGRELGQAGFAEYLAPQSIQL
jgi:aldehyde dehydrogenase (NAD+)